LLSAFLCPPKSDEGGSFASAAAISAQEGAPVVEQAVAIDGHQRMAAEGELHELESSALPGERHHVPVRGDVPEIDGI
jgi:hypothetical protein